MMSAHIQLFVGMLGLLAMQLAATHPLLSFSTLFVSEEEEGFVRNIEFADQLSSSEEVATTSSASFCATTSSTHMSPNVIKSAYEIFAKVLVRDSRKVTKDKLRELKSTHTGKEVSIGYFYVMLRTFHKVDVTWEGELIYFAIWEIANKGSHAENNKSKTTWLEQLVERIVCMALKAESQADTNNLVDNITIEHEISEHFDVFKQFWLDYAKVKKVTTSAPTTDQNRGFEDVSCVIPMSIPLSTANITYSVFAEVLIRDSQIVIKEKLDDSRHGNLAEATDLSKMLRIIKSYQTSAVDQQGKLMYMQLREIMQRRSEEDSFWHISLLDRILCHAQEVRTERDFRNLVEKITLTDTIREHFEVIKEFWLSH